IEAEPPTIKAAGSAELSSILHPMRTTRGFPCTVMAPPAFRSSATKHPYPALATATARADTMVGFDSHKPENTDDCGCWSTTSIASVDVVRRPDFGGRLTKTMTPFTPFWNP